MEDISHSNRICYRLAADKAQYNPQSETPSLFGQKGKPLPLKHTVSSHTKGPSRGSSSRPCVHSSKLATQPSPSSPTSVYPSMTMTYATYFPHASPALQWKHHHSGMCILFAVLRLQSLAECWCFQYDDTELRQGRE